MIILPVAAELFHAGGWTDRRIDVTKLIVTLRNFLNAPKNSYVYFENHTKLTNVVCRSNVVSSFCMWHNIETKCVLKGKTTLTDSQCYLTDKELRIS
jgi:hypothetical protein